MAPTKSKPAKKTAKSAANGKPAAPDAADVLTLAEAAAYLRVSEDAVVKAVHKDKLPGCEIGGEWRFVKSSLKDWLDSGPANSGNEAFLALAGAWKDDPYVDEMLEEIYKKRGRPMVEVEE